jgi:hypothetical protein
MGERTRLYGGEQCCAANGELCDDTRTRNQYVDRVVTWSAIQFSGLTFAYISNVRRRTKVSCAIALNFLVALNRVGTIMACLDWVYQQTATCCQANPATAIVGEHLGLRSRRIAVACVLTEVRATSAQLLIHDREGPIEKC